MSQVAKQVFWDHCCNKRFLYVNGEVEEHSRVGETEESGEGWREEFIRH